MEMSIDKSLANLKELQKDYQQFHDDVWQDPESYGVMAESLQVAIDTMRKYQKIEDLWNRCHTFDHDKHFQMIGQIIEKGDIQIY